jgi:hypothetical protein
MEQRTVEWFEARRGKFTASKVSCLIGKTITATAHTYILEKIVESVYGIKEGITTEAMNWGIVQEVGFYSYSPNFGGSPDGLIVGEGVIEIKCPFNPINHLRYGLCKTPKDLKKLSKANYWQCVANMLATDTGYCDFMSYDPRLEGAAKMFILRIERDKEAETELINAIVRAVEYRQQLRTQLSI